ncbi:MAG: hypothetical protein ABIJ59_09735 [Pseudomonadota bacterium]
MSRQTQWIKTALFLYELTQSSMSEQNKDRLRVYLDMDASCKSYLEKREKFAKAWPMLEIAIQKQMKLWQEKGLDPQNPIIDRRITEAISNDSAV